MTCVEMPKAEYPAERASKQSAPAERQALPLRLLYLLPSEAFGGAERQGVEHIRALRRLGMDVTALVGPGTAVVNALKASGVNQYVFFKEFPSTGRKRPAWAGTVGDWLEWAKAARRCRRSVLGVARSKHFDAVFANRSIAWPLAAMISAQYGIPYVIRAGGRPANPLTRIPLAVLRYAYPPPALLVANCEAVRAPLARWFACPSGILLNCVDLSRYAPQDSIPCRARLGLPADRPIVGMAARPAPEKGLGLLARVAQLTRREVPNVLFVIAGDHVTRPYYERMTAKMGLSSAVAFLGHVEDMASFYASCDVVVLTSPQVSIEGSPNALLEAMAMARPIVSTRVGGVPELIRDGIEGFLVDPLDASGFSAQLTLLLEQPGLRQHMGASGRRRAADLFDVDRVALQLAVIVRTCAATTVVREGVALTPGTVGGVRR
jgi:glycosyltransferase involved in cell wall biosynthesis